MTTGTFRGWHARLSGDGCVVTEGPFMDEETAFEALDDLARWHGSRPVTERFVYFDPDDEEVVW